MNPSVVAITANVLFPAIAVVSGGLGGFQFQVAGRLYFGGGNEPEKSPGAVYALDITGACFGALLISVYLLPVFGFLNTAIVLALVNAAPVIVARFTNR